MDGLEATREIVATFPSCRVVMLTTFDLDDYVFEALRVGASGFLLKDSPRHDLIAAVRAAAAGDALCSPSVTRRLIESFARRPAAAVVSPSRLESLTGRERDVLLHLARGLTNAEIAEALVLSEATIKTHLGNLFAKLGLRDRVQAVILAYETGLITPGRPPAPLRGARPVAYVAIRKWSRLRARSITRSICGGTPVSCTTVACRAARRRTATSAPRPAASTNVSPLTLITR